MPRRRTSTRRSIYAARARGPRVAHRLLAIGLFLVAGCATPVGVRRIGERAVQQQLTANILSSKSLSAYTNQFLERLSLGDRYQNDPKAVLTELHAGLAGPDGRDRLFALAELSFAYGEKIQDRSYYLAAAVYADIFLFPTDPAQAPARYDPRLRLAMDLYNHAVTNGLATPDRAAVDLSPRSVPLPFAVLDLSVAPAAWEYGDGLYQLQDFVSVSDLDVRGLRNRYRRAGIGAPLVARVRRKSDEASSKRVPENSKVPVTAFVRFEKPERALGGGKLHGTIELYDGDQVSTVHLDNYAVPLEFEPSSALAYRLEGSPVWDFEIAGFRRGDLGIAGADAEGALFFLAPYHPGRIPVVFVHGTASSPARWAEMANELLGDPRIAARYQIWYFIYNTGNPTVLSAMHLREGLQAARKEADPQGHDAALNAMVVVGHSQGGLLTKMTVVDSDNRFWEAQSSVPFEQADLSPDVRDLLRRSLFVEPLPFVRRVIFIATPHRGSFLTEGVSARIARRLVTVPASVTKASVELVKLNPVGAAQAVWHVPTSIDSMDWSSPSLRTLASLPIDPRVHAHSIIAVKGGGAAEEEDDGVVKYTSAHLDGVDSELIVRSGHSTQSEPATIEEVRRILYLHLAEVDKRAPSVMPFSQQPMTDLQRLLAAP